MPKIDIHNISGEVVGQMDLSEELFATDINEDCVRDAVRTHLANKRQGNQSAKTRAEVSGGGRKPWRQKGTGRARQGSIRSPQWIGGGVVFAPKPRDYSINLNRKVKRKALKSVLTDKFNSGNLIVLDEFTMEKPKTKKFVEVLKALNIDKKALFVTEKSDINIVNSGRNIKGIQVSFADIINTYDILNHEKLVMTKDAVIRAQEVFV